LQRGQKGFRRTGKGGTEEYVFAPFVKTPAKTQGCRKSFLPSLGRQVKGGKNSPLLPALQIDERTVEIFGGVWGTATNNSA
jgi:hypothetical protein